MPGKVATEALVPSRRRLSEGQVEDQSTWPLTFHAAPSMRIRIIQIMSDLERHPHVDNQVMPPADALQPA